jgi:hypothetical protein
MRQVVSEWLIRHVIVPPQGLANDRVGFSPPQPGELLHTRRLLLLIVHKAQSVFVLQKVGAQEIRAALQSLR